ncbi:alpha-D-ribose 1-methylphosphonate 5-triphosphate diphosphatase [Halocynthiibacter styelae]|uniref:Alpha-D-ribose 1-methylphosphonate 5-triphosphate diphosphatase n=1 Tax=Halocynthiibacter styelae TaxID=2761955 RepID=A0A8J7IVP7_9RHOB|nr:alpha-D-ribose 1-methylphosphonate 5-triphosphate diphosphatase [Paenihalocynthiibacter styelae]MBI1493503.1 alpha-D-ribose 1-methylphosphonate 5-triphosphate diphosphatase [Paenihalocynthiibacter styelae]
MTEILFNNARVILPDGELTGSVLVRDGRIADISSGSSTSGYDLDGDILAPGLIELHTDNLERHLRPRPSVHWPHYAAIAAHDGEIATCGITTVFDALRIGSITTGKKSDYGRYAREVATEILAMRERNALRISHFLHLRAEICSETLLEEFADFTPEDRIGIVSLMDHTPGQRQFRNLDQLRTYQMGKYSMTEAEFDAHVENLYMISAKHAEHHISQGVREAERLGAVLASHDDTDLTHVKASVDQGVKFAEFPTTLEAAKATHAAGIKVMMGAPNIMRGGSHSGNVAAEDCARAECLDILSSDYIPSALLLSAFKLADIWGNLPRAMSTVTRAPADAAGLSDRGRIEVGARADLIRIRVAKGTPVVHETWVEGRRVA